jgi:phytoene dehydrogenase-like protein
MVAPKTILIIGAGVGGLSAGCYTQMNGYQTQIFEMNDKAGGLCTAWVRKGYKIDGCLQWLVGSSPKSNYYHLWQEVGALQGKKVIDMEIFSRFENAEGQVFNLYTDVDKLQAHMLEIAPEDSVYILEICAAIRKFSGFGLPADKAIELYGLLDNLKVLSQVGPYIGDLKKWGKMTMRDFASRFTNPFLRKAWHTVWQLDSSCLFIILVLAWMSQKNAGYVIGGSREVVDGMEKRYLELGGKINYKARVSKILVENGQAVGLLLDNGQEHRGDYVISAADGHATIFEMLEGKYHDEKISGYYEKMPVFKPLVYVGLGVNRSFEDLPQMISGLVFPLEKPLVIAGQEEQEIKARIFNFDPTLAPAGKTVITLMFRTEFAYWKTLHGNIAAYNAEKARIAAQVVSALDKRFPGLAGQVEMIDVSTPVTFERYTGNWQASMEGWLLTPDNLTLQMKKALPGLTNFYMVGQWVQPGGGLPSGLMTGCHLTQVLCKGDSRKYCALCPR